MQPPNSRESRPTPEELADYRIVEDLMRLEVREADYFYRLKKKRHADLVERKKEGEMIDSTLLEEMALRVERAEIGVRQAKAKALAAGINIDDATD